VPISQYVKFQGIRRWSFGHTIHDHFIAIHQEEKTT